MMNSEELITCVKAYVEEHIADFHKTRIDKLQSMKIEELLKKKNPYMYRAKNLNNSCDLVKDLADAFISSAEESIFGNWLEQLAIFVNEKVYGGQKSAVHGADLEFVKDGIRYLVSVKSGPNWANDSQWKKLSEDFKTARGVLRTSGNRLQVECVCGCCYGRKNAYKEKLEIQQYCGEMFWTLISDCPTLYKDIIEPLATDAKKHNDSYQEEYNKMITKINCAFVQDFCSSETGEINWNKIIELNSAKEKPQKEKKSKSSPKAKQKSGNTTSPSKSKRVVRIAPKPKVKPYEPSLPLSDKAAEEDI